MMKGYELLLDDWESGNYYSESSTIPTLYSLIKRLHAYVPTDKYIYSWRQNEEWPESLEYPILSSVVHLLLNPGEEDVPEGIKEFVGEQVFIDEDSRKKLLFNAYFKTYMNIENLNVSISRYQIELPKEFQIESLLMELYGESNYIYLFSGFDESEISNEKLVNLIEQDGNMDFPLRPWTLDLRVAMHFTSFDDRDSRVTEKLCDRKPFRLIFITKQNKICYISDKGSWEAEVLTPHGRYFYHSHFEIDIPFYGDLDRLTPKKFLFVVIDKMEPIVYGKMNYAGFERYINNLYSKLIKEKSPSGDGDSESELDPSFEEEVKRIYDENISMIKAKSKKHKKKKSKSKKHKKKKNTKLKKKRKRNKSKMR
tara:strand:- start:154 stop:1257 length:1104 start_codon:yes stop_codon:yes gene_type:complete